MRLSRAVFIACMVFAFPGIANSAGGQQEWKNVDGLTMSAEIVGYDYETKSVILKKGTASPTNTR